MLPIAALLPLIEQLLSVAARLLDQAEADGASDQATLQELQTRLHVTAAQVASYRSIGMGIQRDTTSQGGVGEVAHVRPETPSP